MKKNRGDLLACDIPDDVTELPDNLVVPGRLDLCGSDIESLPKNLVVQDELFLMDSLIEKIPADLKVNGTLFLSFTNVKSLPDNFTVGEDLVIRDTEIKSLPKNLTVGRNLYMDDMLPSKGGLTVGGAMIVKDLLIVPLTNMSHLPKIFQDDMLQDLTDDYNDTEWRHYIAFDYDNNDKYDDDFEDEDEIENRLYGYMKDFYQEFADEFEQRFIQRYSKKPEEFNLIYNLDSENHVVAIGFSHDKKVIDDIITEFPFSLVEDERALKNECIRAEMIATVAGDKIYGTEDNPLRDKEPDLDAMPRAIKAVLNKLSKEK